MDELIAKLEAAAEGDRELDAEIAVAVRALVGVDDQSLPDWVDRNFPTWRSRGDGRVEVVHEDGTGGLNWLPWIYTTSLDAALTLVPEGWRIYLWESCVEKDRHRDVGPWWGCDISRYEPYTLIRGARDAKSPALALCIAALMARAYLSDNRDSENG